jgi:hypothetical protein
MALEKMDDLFGVTELVKQLDDEESIHAVSSEKRPAHAEEIEVRPSTN